MRKFKFLGDKYGVYGLDFIVGKVYDSSFNKSPWRQVGDLANNNPEDWEEVFDESPWISVNDRLPGIKVFFVITDTG